MMTRYNSIKIRVLNSVAIVLVLYIHNVYTEAGSYSVANYIQTALGYGGISLLANPLFFCISGFLFFNGINSIKDCYPKIKKRGRTLLVPYIIWNIIFVIWFVVLQNLPGISSMINSDVVGEITHNGLLNGLYVVFIKPIAFQLWFVRDLMLYVIFSPVIFFLLKHTKCFLPIALFIISWLGLMYLPSGIRLWGAFFFVLGGLIAVYYSLEKVSSVLKKPVIIIALLLYVVNALLTPLVEELIPGSGVLFMLCGVIAIWGGYDLLIKNEDSKLVNKLAFGGGYSFFVYCFHEPVLNIIKKVGLKVLGASDVSLTILYVVNPLVMCAIAILLAMMLQRYIPKIYSILMGGR